MSEIAEAPVLTQADLTVLRPLLDAARAEAEERTARENAEAVAAIERDQQIRELEAREARARTGILDVQDSWITDALRVVARVKQDADLRADHNRIIQALARHGIHVPRVQPVAERAILNSAEYDLRQTIREIDFAFKVRL